MRIKKYKNNGEGERNNERLIQYNSFNPEAGIPEILTLHQLRKIVPSLEVLALITSSTCCDSVILPSALKTHDRQSPGPSQTLVETEENSGNKEENPDAPEPAAEGHTQMEYSSD